MHINVHLILNNYSNVPDLTICMLNMAGVLQEAGTAYSSQASRFTPCLLVESVTDKLYHLLLLHCML